MEVCVMVVGVGCHPQAGQELPVADTAINNVYMCNLRDMGYRGGKVPIISLPLPPPSCQTKLGDARNPGA